MEGRNLNEASARFDNKVRLFESENQLVNNKEELRRLEEGELKAEEARPEIVDVLTARRNSLQAEQARLTAEINYLKQE